jgi:hypothetical protein
VADFWRDLVVTSMREMAARLASVLPSILAMLTLLAAGLVAGALVRAVLTRLLRVVRFDQRGQAWGVAAALARAGIGQTPTQIVGLVAFWGVFVIFATMGVDALGLPGTSGVTAAVVQLLPRLLASGLLLVVGWLAANFLGQGVLVAAVNAGMPEARLLARGVRWAVLFFAFATALTHLGIGAEMVMVTFGITFGGVVLALALAFGLGGRHVAREVLERRLARREGPHPRETITHI